MHPPRAASSPASRPSFAMPTLPSRRSTACCAATSRPSWPPACGISTIASLRRRFRSRAASPATADRFLTVRTSASICPRRCARMASTYRCWMPRPTPISTPSSRPIAAGRDVPVVRHRRPGRRARRPLPGPMPGPAASDPGAHRLGPCDRRRPARRDGTPPALHPRRRHRGAGCGPAVAGIGCRRGLCGAACRYVSPRSRPPHCRQVQRSPRNPARNRDPVRRRRRNPARALRFAVRPAPRGRWRAGPRRAHIPTSRRRPGRPACRLQVRRVRRRRLPGPLVPRLSPARSVNGFHGNLKWSVNFCSERCLSGSAISMLSDGG